MRNSAGLMSLPTALVQIHFPDSMPALEAARKRLAFDELFLLQFGLLKQKQQWRSETGRALNARDRALLDTFIQSLPYPLTEAQQRVIDDILSDIGTTASHEPLDAGRCGIGQDGGGGRGDVPHGAVGRAGGHHGPDRDSGRTALTRI